jgi:SAM-dependent methyltransferase
MSTVHQSAAKGYQSAADKYQRGRPDYAPQVFTWLRDKLGAEPNSIVVDLGAGTGKFTKRICDISEHVIAVDPVDAMREKLAADLPQVEVIKGTADKMPLDDDSVDILVCSQSFHWFASSAAVAEIHRILKPGGRFGLVWNVRDERTDWVAELTKIITPYEGDAPRYYKGDWREPFPAPGFGLLEETRFVNAHIGTPEDVIFNRFMSVSFIAAQDETTRADIEGQIRNLITTHPALMGKSEVVFPYVTECFWCVKEG